MCRFSMVGVVALRIPDCEGKVRTTVQSSGWMGCSAEMSYKAEMLHLLPRMTRSCLDHHGLGGE
jgi:hypothetical protein